MEKHVDETGVSAKGIQKPVPVVVYRLQSARAALAQVQLYILSANVPVVCPVGCVTVVPGYPCSIIAWRLARSSR